MRLPIDKLLEKLGVDRTLHPYETQPWFFFDEAESTTWSAEVRMGSTATDFEAEIQKMADEQDEDSSEDGSGSGDEGNIRPKQILLMHAKNIQDGRWEIKTLKIEDEDYANKIGNWQEKGCDFFVACIQSMLMDEAPDIEELKKEHMKDDDLWRGGRGKIGRKSPNVNPSSLLGMKK